MLMKNTQTKGVALACNNNGSRVGTEPANKAEMSSVHYIEIF